MRLSRNGDSVLAGELRRWAAHRETMRMLAICATISVGGAWLAAGGQSAPVRASSQVTSQDSVAIVRAVWRTVTAGHASHRAVRLLSPLARDTVGIVPLSPTIIDRLVRGGISIVPRRQAGDDTVVFRITRWESDPDSRRVILEIRSSWTTVLGTGARACRTGSGNVEQLRVSYRAGEWTSEQRGPVMHGDNVCVPLHRGASRRARPA
jgi:hypothetical protein